MIKKSNAERCVEIRQRQFEINVGCKYYRLKNKSLINVYGMSMAGQ